ADMEFPNPGSSVSACALSGGKWVLVYNDAEHGRHNLAIALSEDEGKTWPYKTMIEQSDDETESFGYPTIMEGSDGDIHLSYSYKGPAGASITYRTLSVASLKQ